jgi:hypothetical protein
VHGVVVTVTNTDVYSCERFSDVEAHILRDLIEAWVGASTIFMSAIVA